MLEVGDRAPDFSLSGSDGQTHSLEQFRGKKAVALALRFEQTNNLNDAIESYAKSIEAYVEEEKVEAQKRQDAENARRAALVEEVTA